MAEQVPSIGRVVHFVALNGTHIPADICSVSEDGLVDLFVKDSARGWTGFAYRVLLDPTGTEPATYHWPEYVPAK